MANRWGKNGNSDRLYFLGLQNSCGQWLQPWNQKMLAPWKKSYDKPRQCIKKQWHHFTDKGPSSQSYGFSIVMYGCESWTTTKDWALKNWCFQTVVLEKTLESPLDSKKIKPVNPKGNQFWVFIGRTDAEAEGPILWAPDVKSWLTRKDPAWFWERLKIGEGGNRRWDCWMASLTQWTRVWANSRRQWRTGNYGMLQSLGSQRARHDWAIE